MKVGMRVVRGPHWKWEDQDGGEGNVGTVTDIPATAPRTALVQWDAKPMMNYRAGFNERYDLRIFDSAPSGIKHELPCAGCKDRVICGILWCCSDCPGVYLCTHCYMNDKHSINHNFKRINDSSSPPIAVPPRRVSRKLDSWGIFQNSTVKRGKDWTWENQDGDGQGTVVSLQGWSEESSRSVVSVEWHNGATNVYRLGHRGKTDLFAVKASKGWPYYIDHLPNFGEEIVQRRLPIFAVGENVRVDMNTVRVQNLSEGHGQWHDNMKNYIGQYGIVHRITENDDVRIIFSDRQKWTYNPKAINKVFRHNDKVMLTEDIDTLKEYHGDQLNLFSRLRGKRGIITELRQDTYLHFVQFIGGYNHYVHANCLYAVDSVQHANALAQVDDQQCAAVAAQLQQQQLEQKPIVGPGSAPPQLEMMDTSAPLAGNILLEAPVAQPSAPTDDETARFFDHLDKGNVDELKIMLEKYPILVNSEKDGLKALFLAVHTGKPDILDLLENYRVNLNVLDAEGDSAVHAAIKRNFLQLLPIFAHPYWHPLLNNNSNRDHYSPLHLCIKLGCIDGVKFLMTLKEVDHSTKDFEGNLPIQLAIVNDGDEIAELLLQATNAPSTVTCPNDDGHNALHLACIKGKPRLIQKILRVNTELINKSNKKGFSPIHLAAFHNQQQAMNVLLQESFLWPNHRVMRNKDFTSYTALHLAVHKMHPKIIELLVEVGQLLVKHSGMSLTEDVYNFTPLHMAVDALVKTGCSLTAQELLQLQQVDGSDFKMDTLLARCGRCVPLAVCCYLIAHGADIHSKNRRGFTPIEMLVTDQNLKKLESTLMVFTSKRIKPNTALVLREKMQVATVSHSNNGNNSSACSSASAIAGPSSSAPKCNEAEGDQCPLCCENKANVRFEPCNHIVFCVRCVHKLGADIKKCFTCKMDVMSKIGPGGEIRPVVSTEAAPDVLCQLCMERMKNVAARCGHTMCRECSRIMRECPYCRQPLVEIRALYL